MKIIVREICGHSFIASLIKSNACVVDLGGNLGDFSIKLSTLFNCSCYVAEPIPALFNQIPVSDSIHKFNVAIGNESLWTDFYLSDDIESGSLVYNTSSSSEKVKVRSITLQDFLRDLSCKEIDLLKVDVEGAERDIFNTFDWDKFKNIRQISIEFHDFRPEMISKSEVDKIKKKIQGEGYYCVSWHFKDNMDVLFVHRNCINLAQYIYIKYILRVASKIIKKFQ